MLLIHISLALIGLVWTGITWIMPSQQKIHAAYGLLAGTLFSGTYLVVWQHRPLMHACATGLLYSAISLTGITASRRKLAHQHMS